jgi:hypothetical protein
MIRLSAAAHIFMSVLIIGTGWRMACYHALASSNPTIQHLGAAGRIQY